MILHTEIAELFRSKGAKIISEEYIFAENLPKIKALIFDWDGVFNEGWKGDGVLSPFSEIDSMGINMLRFALWLKSGEIPKVFIVTGLKNLSAQAVANRESFSALYLECVNKTFAMEHIYKSFGIESSEMICFFDDILDVPMAKDCGLRMYVHRKSKLLFEKYLTENSLCDYVTMSESGEPAIREICEFLLGMGGMYNETIAQRIQFSDQYKEYLDQRKQSELQLFRFNGQEIVNYIQ